jgi:rubrerythrin
MTTGASLVALQQALEFEKNGKQYYAEAAEKTKDPQTKALFNMLVDEEQNHLNYLLNLYEYLKANDNWPEKITISMDQDFEQIFAKARLEIDTNVKASTDEMQAMKHAVDMENKGRAMYQNLASKAQDPLEKELYELLADWEKGHAAYCEDYYNYYMDHGMFTEE